MIEEIKNRIIEIVRGLELDGNALIQDIYDSVTENFDGYPSAVVTFQSTGGDILTTNANERMLIFLVTVFNNFESIKSQSQAQTTMNNIADTLIDSVEKDSELKTHSIIMQPVSASERRVVTTTSGSNLVQNFLISMIVLR